MDKDPKAPARPTREAKLAEALRANLRRRKAAVATTAEPSSPPGSAANPQDPD